MAAKTAKILAVASVMGQAEDERGEASELRGGLQELPCVSAQSQPPSLKSAAYDRTMARVTQMAKKAAEGDTWAMQLEKLRARQQRASSSSSQA